MSSTLCCPLHPTICYRYTHPKTHSSSTNHLPSLTVSPPIIIGISFDGTHFLTNSYSYEKNYAFLPGFVLLVKLIRLLFSPSIGIIIILVVNKICTALSSVVLMNIVNQLTRESRLGTLSAVLFLFNPASIFYHAVYSEAIYSLIVFAGIFKALGI